MFLTRIQKWYQTNCNNDWEHRYGFTISTLDNPGWVIKIDLAETSLENLQFERNIANGRFDWLTIKVIDSVFECYCDPSKLDEVLRIFLDEIIPGYADENFHYLVYLPLKGASTNAWRPASAKMLTEEILEIVSIPELKFEDIKTKALDDITFNRVEILTFKTEYSIGDKIKTCLTEMFDGVTLIVREE
ncbi:MAG: immunity 53 family protein [Chitinophagaceae bacterium]|nr:immunity 53 family protein [Chitinophagaceae bacterium]